MKIITNQPLADLTSFGVGGLAEKYIRLGSQAELTEVVGGQLPDQPLWLLGWGTNSLISDQGLPGTTLHIQTGQIEHQGLSLVAEAGVCWDELVAYSINHKLWGLELMSGIPGGVGAASYINISAYGQALADSFAWAEVFDRQQAKIRKIAFEPADWGYKRSPLRDKSLVVLRVAFKLSSAPTTELVYQAALDEAQTLGLDPHDLKQRRQLILAARAKAGAILASQSAQTAGSFFRNPVVSPTQAKKVISFDESGRTAEQIKTMNRVHGGQSRRVSAAHVLLAAGFRRGQTWGSVRLHPANVLKIENTGGAKAQAIYDVSQEIKQVVKAKLGIQLQEEVEILGKFT